MIVVARLYSDSFSMTLPLERRESSGDYRDRLYQRYVSQQMATDVARLRATLDAGQPYYRQLVERHMPADRNAAILDIGCGYGPLLYELKRAGYTKASGVDTSPEQVRVAHELGLDSVREGDVAGTLAATPDASLDAVAAIDVIEHFTKDEVLTLLDHVYRVLKPGGVFLVHVPNGEAIFAGKIFFGDFTHQVAFTRKSIAQVARACGFSSVQCYEDKPIAHGLASAVRAFLWWAIRTKYRFINAAETGEGGSELILSQNLLAVCRK